jgi:hypothetical protein
VQISLVKLNFPDAIISKRSSEPAISAPAFFAKSTLSASHKTATLFFLPDPFGKFTTVLKLKSPPLVCFKLILKETTTDSSNLLVEFFYTKSTASFVSIFLSLRADFKISLNLLDFFFIIIL